MKSIFKFYEASSNAIKSLKSAQVWFSSQEELNDPFEYAVLYEYPKEYNKEAEYENYLRGVFLSKESTIPYEVGNQQINKIKKDDAIIPFVENLIDMAREGHKKDLAGIYTFSSALNVGGMSNPDNILMWSHYCKVFTGFCVEFDQLSLISSFKDNKKFFHHTEIEYVTEPHKISVIECLSPKDSNYVRSVFKKYTAWQYEREYRIMMSSHGLSDFPPSSIIAFYIGYKMCRNYKEQLLNVINSKYGNVQVYEVSPSRESYSLDVKLIDLNQVGN